MLTSIGARGESHHWCGHCRVVVDLGYADPSSPTSPGARAADFDPDVVVLTHSDRDHIGGAHDFFRTLCKRPGRQLWMPYEWGVLLMGVDNLTDGSDPEGTAADYDIALKWLRARVKVVKNSPHVMRDDSLSDHPTDPRNQGRALADSRPHPFPNANNWSDDPTLSGLRLKAPAEAESQADVDAIQSSLEKAFEVEPQMRAEWGDLVESWTGVDKFKKPNVWRPKAIAENIYAKAKSLRFIVRSAEEAGMKIRWFSVDHDPNPVAPQWFSQGETGFATVVNAVEVDVLTARDASLGVTLAAMRLTIQNVRSLAIFLWGHELRSRFRGTAVGAGALIWGDGSGLTCNLSTLPWPLVGLMSAPHHGSGVKPHDAIWDARAKLAPTTCVVFAGGQANQETGARIAAIPRDQVGSTERVRGSVVEYVDVNWTPRWGFSRV